MKNWKYLFLLVALLGGMTSCLTGMGSDDPILPEPPTESAEIYLSCSTGTIYANGEDRTRLTVKKSDGTELTEGVNFFDAATNKAVVLEEMCFSTDQIGTYNLYATYSEEVESEEGELSVVNYTSQSVEIKAISEVYLEPMSYDEEKDDPLTLSVSTTVFQAGKGRAVLVVRFKGEVLQSPDEYVLFNDATDEEIPIVRSGMQSRADGLQLETIRLKSENGTEYELPVFRTETSGEMKFWVSHKIYTTKAKPTKTTSVDFVVPSRPIDSEPENLNFKRRAMLAQFTGLGCKFCPYMVAALEDTLKDEAYADKAVLAAVHTYPGDKFAPEEGLDAMIGSNGYPYVVIDMASGFGNYGYATNKQYLASFIENSVSTPAKAGISASMSLEGNRLAIHMVVKAAVEDSFRVGAWVLENNLTATQTNGGMTGDYDFNTHHNVVRKADSAYSSSNFTGHDLGMVLGAGETADYIFIIDLKEEWKQENCHLLLFVTSAQDNYTVTNAVKNSSLTQSIDFEYAE